MRITPRSIEATEQLDARERARERERQRELVRARGNAGPGVGFSTPHKAEAGTTIRPAPWTDQTLRRAHTDSRSDFEADDVASPLFLRDPSQEAERYRLQAKANEFRREESERACSKLRDQLASAEAKLYIVQSQKEKQDQQLLGVEERIQTLIKLRDAAAQEKIQSERQLGRIRAEYDELKRGEGKKDAVCTLAQQELARMRAQASEAVDGEIALRRELAAAARAAELANARADAVKLEAEKAENKHQECMETATAAAYQARTSLESQLAAAKRELAAAHQQLEEMERETEATSTRVSADVARACASAADARKSAEVSQAQARDLLLNLRAECAQLCVEADGLQGDMALVRKSVCEEVARELQRSEEREKERERERRSERRKAEEREREREREQALMKLREIEIDEMVKDKEREWRERVHEREKERDGERLVSQLELQQQRKKEIEAARERELERAREREAERAQWKTQVDLLQQRERELLQERDTLVQSLHHSMLAMEAHQQEVERARVIVADESASSDTDAGPDEAGQAEAPLQGQGAAGRGGSGDGSGMQIISPRAYESADASTTPKIMEPRLAFLLAKRRSLTSPDEGERGGESEWVRRRAQASPSGLGTPTNAPDVADPALEDRREEELRQRVQVLERRHEEQQEELRRAHAEIVEMQRETVRVREKLSAKHSEMLGHKEQKLQQHLEMLQLREDRHEYDRIVQHAREADHSLQLCMQQVCSLEATLDILQRLSYTLKSSPPRDGDELRGGAGGHACSDLDHRWKDLLEDSEKAISEDDDGDDALWQLCEMEAQLLSCVDSVHATLAEAQRQQGVRNGAWAQEREAERERERQSSLQRVQETEELVLALEREAEREQERDAALRDRARIEGEKALIDSGRLVALELAAELRKKLDDVVTREREAAEERERERELERREREEYECERNRALESVCEATDNMMVVRQQQLEEEFAERERIRDGKREEERKEETAREETRAIVRGWVLERQEANSRETSLEEAMRRLGHTNQELISRLKQLEEELADVKRVREEEGKAQKKREVEQEEAASKLLDKNQELHSRVQQLNEDLLYVHDCQQEQMRDKSERHVIELLHAERDREQEVMLIEAQVCSSVQEMEEQVRVLCGEITVMRREQQRKLQHLMRSICDLKNQHLQKTRAVSEMHILKLLEAENESERELQMCNTQCLEQVQSQLQHQLQLAQRHAVQALEAQRERELIKVEVERLNNELKTLMNLHEGGESVVLEQRRLQKESKAVQEAMRAEMDSLKLDKLQTMQDMQVLQFELVRVSASEAAQSRAVREHCFKRAVLSGIRHRSAVICRKAFGALRLEVLNSWCVRVGELWLTHQNALRCCAMVFSAWKHAGKMIRERGLINLKAGTQVHSTGLQNQDLASMMLLWHATQVSRLL